MHNASRKPAGGVGGSVMEKEKLEIGLVWVVAALGTAIYLLGVYRLI